SVSQVIELTPDQIEPAPSFGTRARAEHLRGLGRLGNRFVLLLALSRVLEDNELLPSSAETTKDESS
ncbi:MAG TPA: hypothetical protein VFB61_05220, partial [Gemmatimonadales bacterium]|nr:hypothetical protein [Gemmatimonadales bacterium]